MYIKSNKGVMRKKELLSEDGKQNKSVRRNVPRSVGERDERHLRTKMMAPIDKLEHDKNFNREMNQNSIHLNRERRHLKIITSNSTKRFPHQINLQVFLELLIFCAQILFLPLIHFTFYLWFQYLKPFDLFSEHE